MSSSYGEGESPDSTPASGPAARATLPRHCLASRSPDGSVAAVEDIGDVVELVAVLGRVPARGPQVRVPKTSRRAVDGHAVVEQRGGPIGAQGVWMREALGHAGGERAGANELVH